jgi:hypothetical protein
MQVFATVVRLADEEDCIRATGNSERPTPDVTPVSEREYDTVKVSMTESEWLSCEDSQCLFLSLPVTGVTGS